MTEQWCNIVILSTVLYIAFIWLYSQVELLFYNVFVVGVLLTESVVLWHQSYKHSITYQSLHRPNVSPGLLLAVYVPLSFMGELASSRQETDNSTLNEEMMLSLMVTGVICVRSAVAESYLLLLVAVMLSLGAALVSWFGYASLLLGLTTCLCVWKLQDLIPGCCPQSFSPGELCLVLQLLASWCHRVMLAAFQIQELTEDVKLACFVCVLVAAVILTTMAVVGLRVHTSPASFVAAYSVAAGASLLLLRFMFKQNPILWFLHFIFGTTVKVTLLIVWLTLLVTAMTWTVVYSLAVTREADRLSVAQSSHPPGSPSLSPPPPAASGSLPPIISGSQPLKASGLLPSLASGGLPPTASGSQPLTSSDLLPPAASGSLPPVARDPPPPTARDPLSPAASGPELFSLRKVFHVFIVLVYLPSLVLDVRLLLLASAAVFGLFIIVEGARATHVPHIGPFLDGILRTFVDDRDQGLLYLTHIYLLVGVSLPLWISHNLFTTQGARLEVYSGVLALGIGDTVACVAGRAWGRIPWRPGHKKTIEGTVCSVVSQVALVLLGSFTGLFAVRNFWNVLAGIWLSSLVEAFTDQIDNLVLPLALFPFLCIS